MDSFRLRRRRINYQLSSEGVDVLMNIVGKAIKSFMLGTRFLSKDELCERKGIVDFSDLIYKSQGGPFFISCEHGKTLVLYDDDFLGSVVLRELDFDVNDSKFFESLELEDKVGVRGSVKHAINLSGEIDIVGKIIEKISIYRLPVNFFGKPNSYDLLNECVICFTVHDVGDILFVCEISENGGSSDIRVSTWERLNKEVLPHLTCIWSCVSQNY